MSFTKYERVKNVHMNVAGCFRQTLRIARLTRYECASRQFIARDSTANVFVLFVVVVIRRKKKPISDSVESINFFFFSSEIGTIFFFFKRRPIIQFEIAKGRQALARVCEERRLRSSDIL